MDPLLFLPTLVPVGAIAGKVIHKKVEENHEEKSRHREVTYYSAEGKLEKRVVRAEVLDGDDAFDANGLRIGYDSHYTRMLEIKILEYPLTSCDCLTCEEERMNEEAMERHRAETLRRIAREKEEAKRYAEMQKREEEARRAAEKARRIREEREAREKAERERKFNIAWNNGEYDHIPVRELLRTGISKDIIVQRIGGPIRWPDYSIAGTEITCYEKLYTGESEEDVRYYEVINILYPNGNKEQSRVPVSEEKYLDNVDEKKNEIVKNYSAQTITDREWLVEQLNQNKLRNEKYLALLRSGRK